MGSTYNKEGIIAKQHYNNSYGTYVENIDIIIYYYKTYVEKIDIILLIINLIDQGQLTVKCSSKRMLPRF